MTDSGGTVSPETTNVGVVGLGQMGSTIASRLSLQGFSVLGYDSDPSMRAPSDGVAKVDDPSALTEVEVLLLLLPNSAAVNSVLLDVGLLAQLRAETVVVDMGSSDPYSTRLLSKRAQELGVRFLDAPVSGGVGGARDGRLAIMVGGAEADYRFVLPILESLGSKVVHVGPCGGGHALKAINNLLSATHLVASSEALLVGQQFGLDPEVMLEVINQSSGRSGSTETKWPNFILTQSFDSGFRLDLMVKDMRIAAAMAERLGRPMPTAISALRQWEAAAASLPASADHTEIVKWIQRQGHTQLGDEGREYE